MNTGTPHGPSREDDGASGTRAIDAEVAARRGAILANAGIAMDRARARRTARRRAAIAATALVASVAAVFLTAPATTKRLGAPTPAPTLAIDFRVVERSAQLVDFAFVETSREPAWLDDITDIEAETALAESGYCARILRVENRALVVDCETGLTTFTR